MDQKARCFVKSYTETPCYFVFQRIKYRAEKTIVEVIQLVARLFLNPELNAYATIKAEVSATINMDSLVM